MNLHQIARALGGEVSSGQVLAPGPGHSKRDRSLAVKLSPGAPDGFVVYNFVDPLDWRPYRDHVRAMLGIVAPARQNFAAPRTFKPASTPSSENPTRDAARRLFAESIDPRGTLGEHYLAHERGLPNVVDDTLALTIRFHPRAPFRDGDKLVYTPALIAALRDPRAAMGACQRLGDMDEIERAFLADPVKVLAVQRIRLDADGRKVERRSLGPLENGVVVVSSIWESFYSATAAICEGVETALAMRALGFTGCAALTGAGRFRTFKPPFNWGSITISGENDAGASQSSWRAAGPRWASEGHAVEIWTPPEGFKDANDLLRDKRQ